MTKDEATLTKNTKLLLDEAYAYVESDYGPFSNEAKATLILAYVQAFTLFANRRK